MKGIRIRREVFKKLFMEKDFNSAGLENLLGTNASCTDDFEDILIGIDDSVFGVKDGTITFIRQRYRVFTTTLRLTSSAPSIYIKSWKDISGEWKYIVQ